MPAIPRSRNNSVSSTVSVKEDEEESSDEADDKPSQSPAQKEKPGDTKENTKVEGLVPWPPSPSQMVVGGRFANPGFGWASDSPPAYWGGPVS